MNKLFLSFLFLGFCSQKSYASYQLSNNEKTELIKKIDRSSEKQGLLLKSCYLKKELLAQYLASRMAALDVNIVDNDEAFFIPGVVDENESREITDTLKKIERFDAEIHFLINYASKDSRLKSRSIPTIERAVEKKSRKKFTASFADRIRLCSPQNLGTALRKRINRRKQAATAVHKRLQANGLVQHLKNNKLTRTAQALHRALMNKSVRAAVAVALRDAEGLDAGAVAKSVERRPDFGKFRDAVHRGCGTVEQTLNSKVYL